MTHSLPEGEKYTRTKEEMLSSIAVFLGGRAAEELAFDKVMTTNNVMALKKMVKTHCPDVPITKTMKAAELKEILKAAILQKETQE